jgi:putative ABC transport system permease protein
MKFTSLIWANLVRKRIRLVLTLGSFTVAMFLFAFLAVVRDAFGRGADSAGADRLVIMNRVSIIQPLPLAYRDKILAIPGAKAITHNNWFGGVYQEEKNFFPQLVIDVENQRQVISELVVSDEQWNNYINDRQGAIVGAGLVKRFGWKIGDRIPIRDVLFGGPATWDFNIDGIYHGKRKQDDDSQFWIQWSYFEEQVPQRFKGNVGWYVLKLDRPEDASHVAKLIDAKFSNSPYETKTETESAFAADWVKQIGNIGYLISAIGAVVFLTLLLVTGNTMAMSIRERTSELAVLKAIGFSDRAVVSVILAEALLLAVIGGTIGLGLAVVCVPLIDTAMNGTVPSLILTGTILVPGLASMLVAGSVSGLLPGIAAMRMQVADALRSA